MLLMQTHCLEVGVIQGKVFQDKTGNFGYKEANECLKWCRLEATVAFFNFIYCVIIRWRGEGT